MKKFLVAFLSLFLILGAVAPVTAQTAPTVLLLYGFNGSTSNWNTAKAAYQAKGYDVRVLSLPRSGWSAGDTVKNADFVEAYIKSNNLTNVKLDGHSLGGWLALYVATVRANPAVSAVVLRDTGTGCFWGIPADQCSGSSLLKSLAVAPLSNVRVLNLNHSSTPVYNVDKTSVYNLEHNTFLTNAAVNAEAISW